MYLYNLFEANSKVLNKFLNEALKFVKGYENQLEPSLDLLNKFYFEPWNLWLNLLKYIPDFKVTELESSMNALKESLELFLNEPNEEKYADLYASYLSLLSTWNSLEGTIRKVLSEKLNPQPGVEIPKKYWELALLILAKEGIPYQYDPFSIEKLREMIPNLWSFRKTFNVYIDLSIGQFHTYPEEYRAFFSAYFKLLNALYEFERDGFDLNYQLLLKYLNVEDLEIFPQLLSYELSPVDPQAIDNELLEAFWDSLAVDKLGYILVNESSYNANLKLDPDYRNISFLEDLSDLLPRYIFVVENINVPDEEFKLLRDFLKLAFEEAMEYYNGLLVDRDLSQVWKELGTSLDELREEALNLKDEITEGFRAKLTKLSENAGLFLERFSSYREKLRARKYMDYLAELCLKANTLYVPSYVLAIEAGRIKVNIPWEDPVERLANTLPPYLRLTEEEKERYLKVLDLNLRLADALEEFVELESMDPVREVWIELTDELPFLEKLEEKMNSEKERFERIVREVLAGRGLKDVQSQVVKLLAFLKHRFSEEELSEEERLELEDIANRIATSIDYTINELQKNLPEELPDEFKDFNEVLELSAKLLDALDAFLEERNLEHLDQALEISIKLDPLLKTLQHQLMDLYTNLQRRAMEELSRLQQSE